MVSGNIGAGKSTLAEALQQKMTNFKYVEEKFRKVETLPLYYEEAEKNEESGD